MAQPTTPRKPSPVYHAHLYNEAGTLAKLDGIIYFMADATGALTEIEQDHCMWLTVL